MQRSAHGWVSELVSLCDLAVAVALLCLGTAMHAAGAGTLDHPAREIDALRSAIEDLIRSQESAYPEGERYLDRLTTLEDRVLEGDVFASAAFVKLRRQALLAHPLLRKCRLLLVQRRPRGYTPSVKDRRIWFSNNAGLELGFPSNHECNSSLPRTGYDNEIAVLEVLDGCSTLRTLYRPPDGGYVGELDLHWNADRLLLTQSDATQWKVFELSLAGAGIRQVSQLPKDVDAFDACYLPDGRIVCGSTAAFQAVPCWHGQKRVTNLYLMNADGTGLRRLCFDQDHDLHPSVLPNGQILYHRWDYTGINHIFLRQLMVMNPDGTGQRAVYGANSWFPNALYFPQAMPGASHSIAAILSGYHGVHKMGQLVLLDTQQGWREAEGIVQRFSGRSQKVEPRIADVLVNKDWPKFLHPFPIDERHILVSGWMRPEDSWGIYLVDVYDNVVKVHEESGWALLEPLLLRPRPVPPVIPDRVDLHREDGIVYVQDLYAGAGLQGVPRGVVRSLRVLAYDFGYVGLAGPDKIGLGGPWEVMRILGVVPIEPDGSVMFRVPANTPLAFQPLDAEGKAVQLMRSWMTLMPGETASCIGCHESQREAAPARPTLASQRPARSIQPWYGPPRGFDFSREVQPVLDQHCVPCHNGTDTAVPLDLRPTAQVAEYAGRRITQMGIDRLDEQMRADTQGTLRYSPAYEALLPYVRRVGIEDDVSVLTPGEYHADTSPLVQMLAKGHGRGRLPDEAWDRLITWIDLNAPFHGAWSNVYPVPKGADQRRATLQRQQSCIDPLDDQTRAFVLARTEASPPPQRLPINPPQEHLSDADHGLGTLHHDLHAAQTRKFKRSPGAYSHTIDLGQGAVLRMVKIPAGEFLMGDAAGPPDEQPVGRVNIAEPFWMSVTEISNRQYQRYQPELEPGYYTRRHARSDDRGLPLDQPDQPVVRVSWKEAMAFCEWMSRSTGKTFSLPTEAQWEWACRAGSASPEYKGGQDPDREARANLADRSFSRGLMKGGKQVTGGLEHLVLEGADLSDRRYSDHAVVTAAVGSYPANHWGLHDMIGNAAEWTRSRYAPYPYHPDDGRNRASAIPTRRVVRGGSFFDPPRRVGPGRRWAYPDWQRVFNVGFRVVCEDPDPSPNSLLTQTP